jgi:5-methylcytosine-specific restriction endonuclease McrBC regulatory subunit McrC
MKKQMNSFTKAKTWYVKDHEKTELLGFELEWLPKTAYKYLTPILKNGIVHIETGPYVGAITLKNKDNLHIIPRCGQRSFSRMIMVADNIDDRLFKEAESAISKFSENESSDQWIKIVAEIFLDYLRTIEKKSLSPERQWLFSRQNTLSGKVHYNRTSIALQKKQNNPIHTRKKVKSFDTIENKFLSEAAFQLIRLNLVPPEKMQTALRWVKTLKKGKLEHKDLGVLFAKLDRDQIDSSRAYYTQALLLARVITGFGGVGFSGDSKIETSSFFTNIPILFEKYIMKCISSYLPQEEFIVQKPTKGEYCLFQDGSIDMEPDILINRNFKPYLVLDSKYKPNKEIPSSDYYQMMTYLTQLKLKTGAFVAPSHHKSSLSHKIANSGEVIYEIRVDISNWQLAEKFLKESIKKVLSGL